MNFITVLSKTWLKENHIQMYSTNNEGKSVVAERFIIRSLKNKIYKHSSKCQQMFILTL